MQSPWIVLRYYFTFSEPVYNVNFKLGGLDDYDRADFFATNGSDNLPVNISDVNIPIGKSLFDTYDKRPEVISAHIISEMLSVIEKKSSV